MTTSLILHSIFGVLLIPYSNLLVLLYLSADTYLLSHTRIQIYNHQGIVAPTTPPAPPKMPGWGDLAVRALPMLPACTSCPTRFITVSNPAFSHAGITINLAAALLEDPGILLSCIPCILVYSIFSFEPWVAEPFVPFGPESLLSPTARLYCRPAVS